MQLKHSEFDIPENDPYQNDLLNRSEFGETLTKIVSNIAGALTVSINGPWGTGKTVFLKMWNQRLKDQGFSTIYFSAWEDDHCDNALIALLGQIWANIKSSDWQEMGNTLKEIFPPLIKNIGGQILTGAVRFATGGIVAPDVETLKSQSEKMLEEYVATTSELKAVKEKLAEVSKTCREQTEKPLVIIIDELDRCRPLFAIELLEKVKHFFELPGIIFVLGIDREQLGHSVRSVYGEQMDVDGYLRRFIDLEFLLKQTNAEPFFESIFAKYGLIIDNPSQRSIEDYSGYAAILSKCFGLSLREMEWLARIIVVASAIDKQIAGLRVLPLLAVLKLRDETFYKRIIGNTGCNATEIIDRLVTEHHAWELFNLDPGTKEGPLDGSYGYDLCTKLYQISPHEWRRKVIDILNKNYSIPPIDEFPQWPKELFHEVVQRLYGVTKNPTYICFESEFRCKISSSMPINDLSKCIELVEFNDNKRR